MGQKEVFDCVVLHGRYSANSHADVDNLVQCYSKYWS